MAKKKGGLAAMLARSKEADKVLARERYAVEKQKEMKDNAKLKRRKQNMPKKLQPATQKPVADNKEAAGEEDQAGEKDGAERSADQVTKDSTDHPISRSALIPFDPSDTVLLVGEGDFSFAVSVLKLGLATRLVPTCLDTEDECIAKYGEAAKENIAFLRAFVPKEENDLEAQALADAAAADEDEDDQGALRLSDFVPKATPWSCAPLFGIDATKLNSLRPIRSVLNRASASALLNPYSESDLRTPAQRARANASRKQRAHDQKQTYFDSIVFNFPHKGAGVADMARSVRSHQDLLVAFFTAAKPLLAPGHGSIAVSLFTGEPYDSWRLRALARQHCNLVVRRSGAFVWQAFPGYHHRLTSKGGSATTAKEAAGRSAKYYVLEREEDSPAAQAAAAKGKKGQVGQGLKGKKLKKAQVQELKKKQQAADDLSDDDD